MSVCYCPDCLHRDSDACNLPGNPCKCCKGCWYVDYEEEAPELGG